MADYLTRALELHNRVPVIDTHSHFLLAGHYLSKRFGKRHRPPLLWNPLRNVIDLPRLREGRVACAAFTIYVPPPPLRLRAWEACRRIVASFEKLLERNSEQVVRVRSARGIRAAFGQEKLAALLAMEGGHVIGRKIERIAWLRERGLRLFTLTHFIANRICDAHFGPRVHGGLSEFGREVLEACVIHGIVCDLAHTSQAAFYQIIERLDRPPVVTHTGLRRHGRSDRFLTDDQLKALASVGGNVGVLMCPWYQSRFGILGSLERAADVYCHIAELIGAQHLMIGTDMDGFTWLPRGMKDASDLPRLTAKLLERGFSEEELTGILGGNFLRVLSAWES